VMKNNTGDTRNSQVFDRPPLIVSSVMVPRADLGAIVGRGANDIEYFVRIDAVLDDVTVFVVLPLLVVVARIVVIQAQTTGTWY